MSGWLKSLNIFLAERGRRLKRQFTQFDISHSLWSQARVVFLPTDWLGDSSRDSFNCWKTFLAASRIRALAASSSSSSSTKDNIKFIGGQKLSLLNKLHRNVYSGASVIRMLWFPVKIVRIGEASGYLKYYDFGFVEKIINICMYCLTIKDHTKDNYYI